MKGIAYILPGHGNAMDFVRAEQILLASSEVAQRLTDLILFDRERSVYLSEYAIVLLEEASSIFSTIAAQLLKISYYLEMLGENKKVKSILGAIDCDALDQMVGEFHSFIMELKGKQGAPVIAKAVQFSKRTNKLIETDRISGLFDPHFLRRIKILLSDFVNVVYGARFTDQETLFDLNDAVKEVIASLQADPVDHHQIFEVLDDDQEFIDELTRRIAYTPLFSSTRFSFSSQEGSLPVFADKLMFQDMLSALLEQFAVSRIDQISLETGKNGMEILLLVAPGGDGKPFRLRETKMLYFQHSMKIAGGKFDRIIVDEKEIYRFIFS